MQYKNSIYDMIKRIYCNYHSISVKKKYFVIESDDWGAVRTPSLNVYNYFKKNGLKVDNDPYFKFDSLEKNNEINDLLDLLSNYKNVNNCHPIITANTIVANPDFFKIQNSNFDKYYYENFTNTLYQRDGNNDVLYTIKKGIDQKLWKPQFHGREHLYVKKWMSDLNNKDKQNTLEAFKFGCYGMTSNVCDSIKNDYMGAFNSSLKQDLDFFQESITDGLNIFEDIFSFRSKSFIPTTYTWHPTIEKVLLQNGVRFLQGLMHQRYPIDDDEHFKFKKNNYMGTFSKSGLMYLTRNAFIEPSLNPKFDWLSDSLNRIQIAFMMKKPVIISSHRLNYIGSLDPSNKDRGLFMLSNLIKNVIKLHPDVEFISSDELGNIILNSINEK